MFEGRRCVMDWIFQGNPKTFDVDGYLAAFTTVTWTIRQAHYADEIQVGDRVFFWRSKGASKGPYGVVAVGEITSRPIIMPDHPEALPYWKVMDENAVALRVWVKVTNCHLKEGKLLPVGTISSDPLLTNLKILKLQQNTNYKINDREGDRLIELYNSSTTEIDVQVSSFSWTVEDRNVAWKVLDKSAILHWGTGIPIAIRSFFIDHEMTPGEKRGVTLLHEGIEYPAHVDLETPATARTRLFWNSDFSSVMKATFPYHHQQYSENLVPESSIIIKFERLDGYKKYRVSFAGDIPEDILKNDIDAEQIEDIGPNKEGQVREYFGKRYERDPKNRALAIKYHGVTCMACGFNFESVYGERGSDYIEVHHKKPIHTFEGKEQQVDPKTDLATLCSNCHRMIHRRSNNILTIEELVWTMSCHKSL
jgi:5-methylcytosine-specific restriction enzyme A